MNVNLAAVKKDRPSLDGGFSNDNDWLGQLPVGCLFYCTTGESAYLTQYYKAWQQGPVVRLVQGEDMENVKHECYVASPKFSQLYKLIHVYKDEDTT